MVKIVAVIGTLDTKGDEFLFVKKEIEKRGHRALVINVGIMEDPMFEPDVPADLEENGYEILIFHQTGTPEILESLVADGYITGVLDITTTEWADEITGGVLPGGPNRHDVISQKGIPQIVAPGCIDMANFWARETVPKQYDHRRFYQWAQNITQMRTTPEENATI